MNPRYAPPAPPAPPKARVSDRQAWAIIAALAAAVILGLTALNALNGGTEPTKGEDIRYQNGEGWAAAHGDNAGWTCGTSGQVVVCHGGTGPTKVAPGVKDKMGMAAEWERGLLVRYNPALWACIRTSARVTCVAR